MRIGAEIEIDGQSMHRRGGFADTGAQWIEERSDLAGQMNGDAELPVELEIASSEIRFVAKALGDFENPAARLWVDAGAIVQCAINRPMEIPAAAATCLMPMVFVGLSFTRVIVLKAQSFQRDGHFSMSGGGHCSRKRRWALPPGRQESSGAGH